MTKTKIPVRDAAKEPTADEKEANDIMDRIFGGAAAATTADANNDAEKPLLEVIGLMLSREQVEAILSVLIAMNPDKSDERFTELMAPVIGPLMEAGFASDRFKVKGTLIPVDGKERLALHVEAIKGNDEKKHQ